MMTVPERQKHVPYIYRTITGPMWLSKTEPVWCWLKQVGDWKTNLERVRWCATSRSIRSDSSLFFKVCRERFNGSIGGASSQIYTVGWHRSPASRAIFWWPVPSLPINKQIKISARRSNYLPGSCQILAIYKIVEEKTADYFGHKTRPRKQYMDVCARARTLCIAELAKKSETEFRPADKGPRYILGGYFTIRTGFALYIYIFFWTFYYLPQKRERDEEGFAILRRTIY